MLIPLPNITYDVQEAIEYYHSLKTNHLDLMWTKAEMTNYLSEDGMTITADLEMNLAYQHAMFLAVVEHKEPFIHWSREQCLEVSNRHFRKLTENVKIWNIKYNDQGKSHTKLERQKELQFGFAKKILNVFPQADVFELIVNPVGTKYNKHSDDNDSIRIIIPIVSDEGAVWHFDNESNVTQFPGKAYMLLKEFNHATDVYGPNDKVSIHFLLNAKFKEDVLNLSCRF
jgi:hypothetical protein